MQCILWIRGGILLGNCAFESFKLCNADDKFKQNFFRDDVMSEIKFKLVEVMTVYFVCLEYHIVFENLYSASQQN